MKPILNILLKIFVGCFFGSTFYFLPNINAQSVSINNSGNPPNASAMLDVSATTKGMLIPRMTSAERIAISSPAEGLLVYQTGGDANEGYWYYDGGAWLKFLQGIVPVSNGGTGASSITGMLKGNGTSAITGITGTANGAAYWVDANTIGSTAVGTAGQVLISNGAGSPPSWSSTPTISVGGVPTTTVNNSSNNPFVCPAGVTKVWVEVWGGGGGSAGGNHGCGSYNSSGGGGGGYAKSLVTVSPGTTYYCTVGSGGTAGGSGGSGGTGGPSCFSTGSGCTGTILVKANGGVGSTINTACTEFLLPGGTGGAGVTGDLLITGQVGTPGGGGGAAPLGGPGGIAGYPGSCGVSLSGSVPGGGAGGAISGVCNGSAGATGKVVIYY